MLLFSLFVDCLSDEGAHNGFEPLQVKTSVVGIKRSFVSPFVDRRLFFKGNMDMIFTGEVSKHQSLGEPWPMGPVRIRRSSHVFGWQTSSLSVDLAGWQAKNGFH